MGKRPQVLQKCRKQDVYFYTYQNIRAIKTRRYRGQGEARETLKAAMKNRPPVAEIVKEITKVVQVEVVFK